jgi:hypothetical protein
MPTARAVHLYSIDADDAAFQYAEVAKRAG